MSKGSEAAALPSITNVDVAHCEDVEQIEAPTSSSRSVQLPNILGTVSTKIEGRSPTGAANDEDERQNIDTNTSGFMNAYRTSTKQKTVIVGTSTQSVLEPGGKEESNLQQLPASWMQQRVNPPGQPDEYHKTKLQWENQIAKHILSMFATSNATIKSIRESSALLDFVETAAGSEVGKDKYSSTCAGKEESRALTTEVECITEVEGEDADDSDSANNTPTRARVKVRKLRKKKKRKKRRSSSEARTGDVAPVKKNERYNADEDAVYNENIQYVEKVMQQLQEQEQQQKMFGSSQQQGQIKSHKHRITNTVRLKNGEEMVIRGTPRCFPIWFVSTGDVYADWTALPGGAKLQAHLNAIYERKKYHDYLGILETVLIELARFKLFGSEEFTLGSFGITEPVPTRTNMNSRAPSAASGKRSSSRRARMKSRGSDFSASGAESRGYEGAESDFGTALEWGYEAEHGVSFPIVPFDTIASSAIDKNGTSLTKTGSRKSVRYSEDTAGGEANERRSMVKEVIKSPVKSGKITPLHQYRSTQAIASNLQQRETVVMDHVPQNDKADYLDLEALKALWHQLVLTAIAMGILCVEQKQLEIGMTLFKRAEEWAKQDELVTDTQQRKELLAHVKDAISFYFYKKGRSVAARGYSEKALELYEQVGNMDGVGACLLHVAAVYSSLGEFKESHKTIFQFLAMVESGRLAHAKASPKQLCLVAIAYHNLAVVQLKLAMPDLACKNSQNARKIARLCLSYSNRWIDVFQFTHEIAISDIKYELATKKVHELTKEQIFVVKELTEALFDPFIDP